MAKNILANIERTAAAKKPLVGFGLAKHNAKILKSLHRARKYANIVLVGPQKLPSERGFRIIRDRNPERRLASLLANGEVDGIVRGTVDDFKTFEEYRDLTGVNIAPDAGELGLVEDAHGRQFFISQASNPSGWSKEQKRHDCETVVNFMHRELGIVPVIGFIAGVRHETFRRRKRAQSPVRRQLNQTYKDAEYLSAYFRRRGIKATNYAIEIQTALNEGCNIIVPPNGMVGNQIFRTLVFLGGGKLLMSPRLNLPHPYEDNSRNETDFESHVRFLAAWIGLRKRRAAAPQEHAA